MPTSSSAPYGSAKCHDVRLVSCNVASRFLRYRTGRNLYFSHSQKNQIDNEPSGHVYGRYARRLKCHPWLGMASRIACGTSAEPTGLAEVIREFSGPLSTDPRPGTRSAAVEARAPQHIGPQARLTNIVCLRSGGAFGTPSQSSGPVAAPRSRDQSRGLRHRRRAPLRRYPSGRAFGP